MQLWKDNISVERETPTGNRANDLTSGLMANVSEPLEYGM